MKKNTIVIKLTLNNYALQKFSDVPTFKNLLHTNQLAALREGENILAVNMTVWGSLRRICGYDANNMKVTKCNNPLSNN